MPTLQHELGSGSSWYRRDVSRMTRTKNFLRQICFKVFLYVTLIIMSQRYFFDFRSPDLPFDIRFRTRGFFLVMRSRKAGLPCATRARKQELSIQEGRIENDSDKIFLKNTFFHDLCHPDNNNNNKLMLFLYSTKRLNNLNLTLMLSRKWYLINSGGCASCLGRGWNYQLIKKTEDYNSTLNPD